AGAAMTIRKLFFFAFLVIILSTLAMAQGSSTGDLHVTVKDPKGELVTNATVTAHEQSKGFERGTATNIAGEYRVLALPPGLYTVSVTAPGFAKTESSGVRITVGQMAELPLSLTVAGTKEIVTVNEATELVETQRTSSTDT